MASLPEKRFHDGLPAIFGPKDKFHHLSHRSMAPWSPGDIVGHGADLRDGIRHSHRQASTTQEAQVKQIVPNVTDLL
jgi:hypothetical protein